MKKLLAIFLSFAFCLVLAGCGPSQKEEAQNLYDGNFGEKGKFTVIYQQASTISAEIKSLNKRPSQEKIQSYLNSYKSLAEQTKKLSEKISSSSVNDKNNKLKIAVLDKLNHHNVEYDTMVKIMEAVVEKDRDKFLKCEALSEQLSEKINGINLNLENAYSLATRGIEAAFITYDGESYIAKEASQVFICVSDVEFTCEELGNGFINHAPMGQYAIVQVIVANEQKDAITVDSNCFELVDFSGRVYSGSTRGQTAYDLLHKENNSFLTRLNPGMCHKFVYVFDVPTHFDEHTMNLRAKGGFTGSKVIMPLTKITVPQK